ncbi:MAG: STAS domain-containing protein [Rhodothermales bacterium]
MSIRVEPTNQNSVIVRVGKSLDLGTATEFKQVCNDQLREGSRYFILDFNETKILDSTGLGAIFSLYRDIVPLDGVVVFAALSEAVRVVVQVTRIHQVFPHYPSVQEARMALA